MGIVVLSSANHSVDWATPLALEQNAPDHIQVAQICKHLSQQDLTNAHLVALPGLAKFFPAIQVFLRANHARVLSYVCIDELPLGQLVEWPDAQVAYIDTTQNLENLNLARLRNWHVINTDTSNLQSAVTSCVALFE